MGKGTLTLVIQMLHALATAVLMLLTVELLGVARTLLVRTMVP